MYSRIIIPPKDKSFFLFGPRGTGKTTWVKKAFPRAIFIDLLESGCVLAVFGDGQLFAGVDIEYLGGGAGLRG